MSSINFNILVERLLKESLGEDIYSLLSIPGNITIPDCAKWAYRLTQAKAGSYIKVDELLGLRPAWPIIDTFYYIIRILQDYKMVAGFNEPAAENLGKIFNSAKDVEQFLKKVQTKKDVEKDVKKRVIQAINDKIEYLKENFNNYRDYSSIRLSQITDQTQILAAEEYLNLTPYDATMRLLKEYGGYDMKLVDNILKYPGETRFTQKSNIEGPVLATIVEISKLMLLFYREYIVEQKEKTGKPVVESVMSALNISNLNEFKRVLEKSAGKLNAVGNAGKKLQQDYINFIDGSSVFTIDPNVLPPVDMPMQPPKPAIGVIGDFRNITGISQEIYRAFLSLFNNIKTGTEPSKWRVGGKLVMGGIDAAAKIAWGLAAASGHSLYGGN
jgi:hypothetical protein